MKKLALLICLLLVGCSHPTVYDQYVMELKQETMVSENVPFSVNVYLDDINETKWIYQVVIDQPKEDLKNIRALVIHDAKTKDVFPSVGIVDEPITFDDKTKGINLVGYVEKKENIQFKILIETDTQKYVVIYNNR